MTLLKEAPSNTFAFSPAELDAVKDDRHKWQEFIRRREAEMVLSLFDPPRFQSALELGAGDGGQSVTIAKFCDRLICTELAENGSAHFGKQHALFHDRNLPNVEYRLCDAQDLSDFSDHSFDLIFSSNMLEHVPDSLRALRECRRLLKPEGVMVHTMPTRVWKVFETSLMIARGIRPDVHTPEVGRTHLSEFIEFGRGPWVLKFEQAGLTVEKCIGMPFYVGHGNRFVPLIKLGNLLGLSATIAYIARKNLAPA